MTNAKRRLAPDTRPLTWATMTRPSHVMIPLYLALVAHLAWVYLFDPGGRADRAPGLTAARAMLGDMHWWGALFLLMFICGATCLAFRNRAAFGLWLYAYSLCSLIWAGIYIASVKQSPDASLSLPGYPVLVAGAAYASARSVLTREL